MRTETGRSKIEETKLAGFGLLKIYKLCFASPSSLEYILKLELKKTNLYKCFMDKCLGQPTDQICPLHLSFQVRGYQVIMFQIRSQT